MPKVRGSSACPSRLHRRFNRQRENSNCRSALFALILGGVGIHKFYLGRVGQGILYLLFCWTFIPAVIGFIEGIIYLTMSDALFEERYG